MLAFRLIPTIVVLLLALPASADPCLDIFVRRADGEPVAIKRIENFRGTPVEVWDVSNYVTEKTHLKDQSMQIFNLGEVFAEKKVFLGFGKPNVYLSFPADPGFEKYAAKSLKRGESQIVQMKTFSQSGILAVFPDLTADQQARLRAIAESYVGSKHWTCVNSNCRVMTDAGFTSGGEPLSQFYMPITLLERIIRVGLELDGQPVRYELVRTSPAKLDGFRELVQDSVKGTLARHLGRAEWMIRLKERSREAFGFIFPSGESPSPETAPPPPSPLRLAPSETAFQEFDLSVSQPSGFGTFLRSLWGAHQLFEVKINPALVDLYLPGTLQPFSKPNPDFVTRLKKGVLFSKPVVRAIRSQMSSSYAEFSRLDEKAFFDMFETHTEATPHTYNVVITGTKVIVTEIQGISKIVDWVLTKHVLMSNYDPDVRFAGEAMKLEDGKIHLTLNSGTYTPGLELVEGLRSFLSATFPNIPFVVETRL